MTAWSFAIGRVGINSRYALQYLQATSSTRYGVVNFSRNGKMYCKRFYEPMHGGSKPARQAAIAWLDEMFVQIKPMTVVEFSQKVHSNNTSGVPGVMFHKTASLKVSGRPGSPWPAANDSESRSRFRCTTSFQARQHPIPAINPAPQLRSDGRLIALFDARGVC